MTARLVLLAERGSARAAGASTAAEVAGRLDAELEACFLENVELLRLSRLPFVRAFSPGVAGPRPFSLESLEAEWGAAATRLREWIADEATRRGVQWRFRVARGNRVGALLRALASGHDVVLATDSTARSIADPIHVRWSSGDAPRRALQLAARMAGTGGIVLLTTVDVDARAVTAIAGELGVHISIVREPLGTALVREGIVVTSPDPSLLRMLADPAFALAPGRALVVTARSVAPRKPMTATEIRDIVTSIITAVAPEADLARLDGKADLRDALDIDSMDFLNVLVGIEETLGVAVPERDYDEVRTLDALVAYVSTAIASGSKRLAAAGSAS